MPLVVLVIYCEWFEQILRVACQTQSVFESLVEVGIELYLVDHVGLVYDEVAGFASAKFTQPFIFIRVALLHGKLLH